MVNAFHHCRTAIITLNLINSQPFDYLCYQDLSVSFSKTKASLTVLAVHKNLEYIWSGKCRNSLGGMSWQTSRTLNNLAWYPPTVMLENSLHLKTYIHKQYNWFGTPWYQSHQCHGQTMILLTIRSYLQICPREPSMYSNPWTWSCIGLDFITDLRQYLKKYPN